MGFNTLIQLNRLLCLWLTASVARKMQRWPRSWANFSLLQLYSHRNVWANLHLLGQPNTFLALWLTASVRVCGSSKRSQREVRRGPGKSVIKCQYSSRRDQYQL
jgi:hypothetical protein